MGGNGHVIALAVTRKKLDHREVIEQTPIQPVARLWSNKACSKCNCKSGKKMSIAYITCTLPLIVQSLSEVPIQVASHAMLSHTQKTHHEQSFQF